MTAFPSPPIFVARPVSNTAIPEAAPGEAAIPLTTGSTPDAASGSSIGCNSCSSLSTFKRSSPFSLVISFSLTMSAENFTIATAFVFAARVCSR